MPEVAEPIICPACDHQIGELTGRTFAQRIDQMQDPMEEHMPSCLPSMRIVKDIKTRGSAQPPVGSEEREGGVDRV